MNKLKTIVSLGVSSALILGLSLGVKLDVGGLSKSYAWDILFFVGIVGLFFFVFKIDKIIRDLEMKKIRKPVLKWTKLKTKR